MEKKGKNWLCVPCKTQQLLTVWFLFMLLYCFCVTNKYVHYKRNVPMKIGIMEM